MSQSWKRREFAGLLHKAGNQSLLLRVSSQPALCLGRRHRFRLSARFFSLSEFFQISKKEAGARRSGHLRVGKGCIYRISLRRRTPAKPRMPEPNSMMLLGSGVVDGLRLIVNDS